MATDEERADLARTGPRHAAPRKPLLSRLHMPAGKAIALAAMPSAVLMGMGLTPTLAQAKPVQPTKPFGDAQCATAPDAAAEAEPGGTPAPGADESGKPSPSSSRSPSPSSSSASPGGAGSGGSGTSRGREPSASSSAQPVPGVKPAPAPAPVPVPSTSPSPSKAVNPLDPLGLGEKLTGILTGGKKATAGPSPAPSAPSAPGVKPAPVPPSPSLPVSEPAQPPSAKAKGGPTPALKVPGEPAATPSPSAKPTPDPSSTASPDADKPLPPCPASHVIDENEKRAFPNQPWYLEASKLTLTGLTYEGVKRITMVNGQQKSVLKFTADSLAIKDLHQIVNNQGKQYHVAGSGTTSTVSGARITMYTEELKGKLLGVLPSTQSPSSLPPLIPGVKLPIPIFFTDVKIRQAGQYGGTLHIPNLRQYLTEGTYP
ncbi:hypothetical protein AB0F13_03500 [Streptomyces sp. NPDC026206]|uniref:hypothetical protein n=1 Tax=Streptomyces sp. NPDC026206 TaxID=3157089 RepID=UPI0033D2A5DE